MLPPSPAPSQGASPQFPLPPPRPIRITPKDSEPSSDSRSLFFPPLLRAPAVSLSDPGDAPTISSPIAGRQPPVPSASSAPDPDIPERFRTVLRFPQPCLPSASPRLGGDSQ